MSKASADVAKTSKAIAPVPGDGHRPRWSVMIPTFNCAQYLQQALESVIAQDRGATQMQIEVIDDCSTTDDPEAVVREVGKGRVSFYRQPTNQGATANFNTCIERSRGSMVHILHGDDWVEPGFYAEMEELSQHHADAALFASRFYFVEEDGCRIEISGRLKRFEQGVSHDIADFWRGPAIHFTCCVIRRQFFEEHGGFVPQLIHAADWELWVRGIRKGGMVTIPGVLGNYRLFQGNDTGRLMRLAENLKDRERCIQILASDYEDFDAKKATGYTLALCERQEREFKKLGDLESVKCNRTFWNSTAGFKPKVKRMLRSIVAPLARRLDL